MAFPLPFNSATPSLSLSYAFPLNVANPAPMQAAQPFALQFVQQLLGDLMRSLSLLANDWSSIVQPAPAVQLPRTPHYIPPNTDYGWPKLEGFQASQRVSEAPTGYQWNREALPSRPGVGHSSEPFRSYLSPVGTPGIEMKQIAPGQYVPLLNANQFPPLPPDTRLSYRFDEKIPAAPPGYQWSGRYPFSTVLTPKGLPDVDLHYSEVGWIASKHHDLPYA